MTWKEAWIPASEQAATCAPIWSDVQVGGAALARGIGVVVTQQGGARTNRPVDVQVSAQTDQAVELNEASRLRASSSVPTSSPQKAKTSGVAAFSFIRAAQQRLEVLASGDVPGGHLHDGPVAGGGQVGQRAVAVCGGGGLVDGENSVPHQAMGLAADQDTGVFGALDQGPSRWASLGLTKAECTSMRAR